VQRKKAGDSDEDEDSDELDSNDEDDSDYEDGGDDEDDGDEEDDEQGGIKKVSPACSGPNVCTRNG